MHQRADRLPESRVAADLSPRAAPAPSVAHELEPPQADRPCLVCAEGSAERICASCRAHIQGEALVDKLAAQRGGQI
jgi:hypothetical protein